MMANQTSKDWCSGGQEECRDCMMRIPETGGDEKMSKPSKEFEYRMQGMIYALNIAKKDGVDGDFGAKCEAAVKDFQAKKGLTADGIYGKKTHAALMSAIADAEPDEEPETPVGDKILVVSGDSVRIRKGNSTAYSIITTVKKGTVLIPVLDKKDNPLVSADGWNAVVLDGQVGWISNKYVREGR